MFKRTCNFHLHQAAIFYGGPTHVAHKRKKYSKLKSKNENFTCDGDINIVCATSKHGENKRQTFGHVGCSKEVNT